MNRKMNLPDFTEAFFNGIALHGLKKIQKKSKAGFSSIIDDFFDNEFNADYDQFPRIQRQRGDCQAIKIATAKYRINFNNTIHTPFFIRQKKYIRVWSDVNGIGLEGKDIWKIQNRINGWTDLITEKQERNEDMRATDFIIQERKSLGDPINLDKDWLIKNTNIVLMYYHHILEFYTKNEQGKKFRLAPLCQVKSHFLTFDNVVLKELLKNVREQAASNGVSFPDWISTKINEDNMDIDVWKAVFNYDGLRRRRTFSRRVDTDGTRISFHFQATKKKLKKRSKNQRKKTRKKNESPRRVIAIDPGRVNLITAYDTVNDTYHKLTRGYYYRATGMKARNKRANLRNLEMKGIYDAMSKTPTRSINETDWYNYQKLVARHYDRLWEMNATEKLRREDFKVKRLKEKCLDRFFNRFREGEGEPIIAYGAATINPSGKGELAVPVKYVYKKCCQRYETEKEDERYSTQMHRKCQQKTCYVKIGSREIKGLRWCSTCGELVSRDKNACKNIAFSYGEEKRPMYLCDTYERGEEERVKRLPGVKSYTQPITGKEILPEKEDGSRILWINGKIILRN